MSIQLTFIGSTPAPVNLSSETYIVTISVKEDGALVGGRYEFLSIYPSDTRVLISDISNGYYTFLIPRDITALTYLYTDPNPDNSVQITPTITFASPASVILTLDPIPTTYLQQVTATATIFDFTGATYIDSLAGVSLSVDGSGLYVDMTKDGGKYTYSLSNPNTTSEISTVGYYALEPLMSKTSSTLQVQWPAVPALTGYTLSVSNADPIWGESIKLTAGLLDQYGVPFPSVERTTIDIFDSRNDQFPIAQVLHMGRNEGEFTYDTTAPDFGQEPAHGLTYTVQYGMLPVSSPIFINWSPHPIATTLSLTANNLAPRTDEFVLLTATVYDENGLTYTSDTEGITLSYLTDSVGMALVGDVFNSTLEDQSSGNGIYATYTVLENDAGLTGSIDIHWIAEAILTSIAMTVSDAYPLYLNDTTLYPIGHDQFGLDMPLSGDIYCSDTDGAHTYTAEFLAATEGSPRTCYCTIPAGDYPAGTTVSYKASHNGVTFNGPVQVYWPVVPLDVSLTQVLIDGYYTADLGTTLTIMHDAGNVGITFAVHDMNAGSYTQPRSTLQLTYGTDVYPLVHVSDNYYTIDGGVTIHDFGVQSVSYGAEDMIVTDTVAGGTGGVIIQYNGFLFSLSSIYDGVPGLTATHAHSITNSTLMTNWQVGTTLPQFALTTEDSTGQALKNGLTGQLFLNKAGESVTLVQQTNDIYYANNDISLDMTGVTGTGIINFDVACGISGATASYPWHLFHYDFDNSTATISPAGPHSGTTITKGTGAVITYNPGTSVINNGEPFVATLTWPLSLGNKEDHGPKASRYIRGAAQPTGSGNGPTKPGVGGGGGGSTSYSQVATWSALEHSGLSFAVDSFLTPGTHTFQINLSFGSGGLTGTIPGISLGAQTFTLTYAEPTFQYFVNGSNSSVIDRMVSQPVSFNVNYYDSIPALWTFPDPHFSVLNTDKVEYPLVPTVGRAGNFHVVGGVSFDTSVAPTFNIVYSGTTGTVAKFEMTYPDSQVPCFFAEAPVLTPSGNKRIDSLKTGDLVVTPKGFAFVKNVRSYDIPASDVTNPYLIPVGLYGASEDLMISPNHAVCVEGKLIAAKYLTLTKQKFIGNLNYFNVELDKWDNMYVAGVEVESLAPAAWVVIAEALAKEK